jgi:DNA primase
MAGLDAWRGLARAIKDRIDLVGLIGQRVALKKTGNAWVGLCPFHGEKTGSFNVIPDKGFYHCHGCGKHGDAIEWVMQRDGLPFAEVVLELAREAGIDPAFYLGAGAKAPVPSGSSESILAINKDMQAWLRGQLQGSPAEAYLANRGFSTPEALERYGFGYVPRDARALIAHLRGKGHSEASLLQTGAFKMIEENVSRPFLASLLRDRVTLPIRDVRGRTIAFAGRVLEKDAKPKYMNTMESEVFKKSETLYGLDFARSHAKDGIKVVEGYFDVATLDHGGVKGVVAPMGTALTPAHVRIIKRYTPKAVLMFDGDDAGLRACDKAIKIALPMGLDVRLFLMPAGEDPDTLMGKLGPEEYLAQLAQAPDWTNHILSRLLANRDPRQAGDRAEIIRGFADYAPYLATKDDKWAFVNNLAHRLEMDRGDVMDILRQAVSKTDPEGGQAAPAPTGGGGGSYDRNAIHPLVEEMVLAFLTVQPETPLEQVPVSWWERLPGAWILQGALDAKETDSDLDPKASMAIREIETKISRLGAAPTPMARLLGKLEVHYLEGETKTYTDAIEDAKRRGSRELMDKLEERVCGMVSRRNAVLRSMRGSR